MFIDFDFPPKTVSTATITKQKVLKGQFDNSAPTLLSESEIEEKIEKEISELENKIHTKIENDIFEKIESLEKEIQKIKNSDLKKIEGLNIEEIKNEIKAEILNEINSLVLKNNLDEEKIKYLVEQYVKLQLEKEIPPETIKIVKEKRNPTIKENKYSVGTVWINQTTGEVFICIDNTPNKNKWVGSFGTVIEPNLFYKVDYFGDNSVIAFYRFNHSPNDEGGIYHGEVLGKSTTYSKGRFDYALDFGEIPNDTNAFAVRNIRLTQQMNFSFWVFKRMSNVITPYISLSWDNTYNGILLFEHMGKFKIVVNDFKIYEFSNSSELGNLQWHFISLNISSIIQYCELWIDGKFIGSVHFNGAGLDLEKHSWSRSRYILRWF